ncbi:muconolactone Delta-isomerase family protein [Aquibium sp. A9E412]|uniref:muconolactone Delta-isomerase n=1 Tax=Aquibium sp. A9E412 TaxID=2976767 RepID=UPI0025AF55F5|nr:muconolactone Delta-isomerase family protein [Aquibium sp. A9E412]MDN2566396.1 muconolactone Delta-isomerase family protein [Aquibium sp. A9E412]
MEFLVNIRFNWPDTITPEERKRLREEELARAAELTEQGHLVRMWRVIGRRENWGLWRAKDGTEMHAVLSSLPIWPYMDIQVVPLAQHAVDPAPPQVE